MLIQNVDLPEPLLDAQENDSLVIFAGAGVSTSPPSNLPNFRKLVEQVAEDTPLTLEYPEPLDHFLGRLLHHGVKVHERVSRILSDPTSKPNMLHSDLLRLFDNPGKLRLVTTNFDLHFTKAAYSLFGSGEQIEVHSAPALPLGNNFQGLVHIHGGIDKPVDRLVLTDADFGRAYLTRGWATRFLQELFSSQYAVLFVGYSHDDPVMNYLARGLPPRSDGPRRFVLTANRPRGQWEYLGIIPITYQLQEGEDEHARARLAVSGWADFARRGMLEHEQRIREIVQGSVPADIETLDYLKRVLKKVATVRFFTRYARTVAWLRWAESTGVMAPLFKEAATYSDIDEELGYWFAGHFVCEHSGDALALARRQGQTLSPLLSRIISHQLFSKKPRPTPDVLGKWIPLLLRSHPPHHQQDFLQYILHDLSFPQDEAIGLLLFGYLTKPAILLTEKFWATVQEDSDDKDVDIELTTGGEDHWLTEAWHQLLRPNLETCGDRLLWLVTSHLQEAYLLLRAGGKTYEKWDPISASRGLIESTGQGSPRGGVGVLIDVARELLEWNLDHRPKNADYLIDSWFASEYRVLQRLAIYGASKSKHWEADKKVSWVLQNDLLYRYGFKHEVFLVLKDSYSHASEQARLAIVGRAVQGPQSDLPDDTKEYETYNLLYWLTTAAPDCLHAKARFSEIAGRHPDFGPRPHPDMDSWFESYSGSWEGQQSPLTLEQVLLKRPEELLNFLESLNPDEFRSSGREGVLRKVGEAVAQSFDWSMHLADFLKEKALLAIDLWDVVLEGWQRSSLTDKQWEQILMLLLDVNQTSSSALYATSRLLKEGTEKSPGGIPSSLSDLSMGLAEKTWSACVVLNHERGEESDDWVSPAINHPAGALVTFSLLMLSQLKKESGQDWKEIPVQHKKFFDFVLTGDSYSAELGRVLIASDLLFLFSLDEQWTANNVVPLLRWLKNPVEWSVRLPSAFPDVVDMIHASPAPKLEHSSIQRELLGSDLPTQYPDSVAKLVLYLLRNRLVPYDLAPVLDIIKKLAPYAVARQHLLAACQELAALGHPDARVLRDTIEGAGSG